MPPALDPDAQQLSTRFTFLHKVILPVVWLGFFGVATLVLLLQPAADRQRVVAFAVAFVGGGFLFLNWGIPLKKVVATRDGLRVSNFRREVLIPYREIVAIRESKIVNTVRVELASRTAIGREILFRPEPVGRLVASHPAVVLLAERASAARTRRE